MTELYLKFANEAEMQTTFGTEEVMGNIDVIGEITLYDYTDLENVIQTKIEGWHNIKAQLSENQIDAFLPFTIPEPLTPFRVWA